MAKFKITLINEETGETLQEARGDAVLFCACANTAPGDPFGPICGCVADGASVNTALCAILGVEAARDNMLAGSTRLKDAYAIRHDLFREAARIDLAELARQAGTA